MSPNPDKAITVVGSINVDFSVTADKLPKPGESVIGNGFLQAFGGKGANQAVGAARLCTRLVRFVGAVGEDELGRAGLDSLKENGVDIEHVRIVPGMSTGVALIMIDRQGENSIVAAPGANAAVDTEFASKLPDDVLRSSAVLVLCQEIPVESLEIIARRAKSFHVPVLFNPAPPNPRLLKSKLLGLVDFLTPNETEAAAISGLELDAMSDDERELEVMQKLSRHGQASIALTLGRKGCRVFDANGMSSAAESVAVPAPTVNAIDTTAAGDSFNAALAVALVEGKEFVDACQWANQCAAISVTRRGAQSSLPHRKELASANR